MDRRLLINIHMYLAAFFVPAVLLVAISGGLYLLGVKGSIEQATVFSSDKVSIDPDSTSLKADVDALLAQAGITSYSYEYVKVKGNILYTRPTSSDHYVIKLHGSGVEVIEAHPSLQNRLIELHKGHGPTVFKTFQKVFALALIVIMLSGLWLGLSVDKLRRSTVLTSGAGLVLFVLLII